MFRPARTVSRNLDLTDRARIKHVPRPQKSPLPPDPDPSWLSAGNAEWAFIQHAVGRSQPSCTGSSVSSRSLYSSEMSDYTARMIYEAVYGEPPTQYGRPSSLRYQVPIKDEVETFPQFEAELENDRCSDHDSDETVRMKEEHEELKKHCIIHCHHLTCRKTRTIDKKNSIQRFCTQNCTKPLQPEPDASSFSALTSTTAKAAYEGRSEDMLINIELSTALPLISYIRQNKDLNMQHFLLSSPSYNPSTILQPRYYKRAAETADDFILGGIGQSLETMLEHRPKQSCLLHVEVLESLLNTLARWDCAEWMKRWVWGGRNKREMVNLRMLEREMDRNEGARVFVERAEECVRDVVGGLVWWDGKMRGGGERVGDGEGQDGIL